MPRSSDEFLHSLSAAARLPLARCPHTDTLVQTPLVAQAWADHFFAFRYPYQRAAIALVSSLRTGVRLGYTGARVGMHKGRNLPTADENIAAIDANMEKELASGRRRGPCDPPPFPFFFSNPLGVVFKKLGGKPRVIHHLSYPRTGGSVNGNVLELEVKLKAFERAVEDLRACGQGAFMAKIDIEAAYRNVPVAPEDWPLQGMRWKGKFFYDIVMQFGLASATAIFEYYSSAAEFFAKRRFGIRFLQHYVDDFLLMAKSEAECLRLRDAVLSLFRELGLPYSLEKLEGPIQQLIFLGILFDSVSMTLRLSEDRLTELKDLLRAWLGRVTGSRQELQSLCGLLNFASSVVRSGRIFFKRILAQLRDIEPKANADDQHKLYPGFYKDIKWWLDFVDTWNGVALLPPPPNAQPSVVVDTDASGKGYGAVITNGTEWLGELWTTEETDMAARSLTLSMPWLELRAIVIAAATWGPQWAGRKVLIRSDCKPAVDAWNFENTATEGMVDLVRTLLFLTATHDFHITVIHIPGVDNPFADLVSRQQATRFLELSTTHSRSPTTPSPPPIQTW